MLIQTIFSLACSSRKTYILTMVSVGCLFVDKFINLCKILTPGGSVLALKILQEVLEDTFCKKLTPGGSVPDLKILPSLIYFVLNHSLPQSFSKQFS